MPKGNKRSAGFQSSQISRRELLASVAASAALASVGSVLLKPGHANAAEPTKGGFMKFGVGGGSQSDTLDPATWPSTFALAALGGSMCNNLTEILPDGSVVPDLAESFEPSEGATKWVFKLRKGSTFHNGKDVTPADIIASVRHHMGEGTNSGAKAMLAQVGSVEADGKDAVTFELKSGVADFPYLLSDFHLPIMPAKAEGGLDWTAKVGTGPFLLEQFEPGVSAKLKRNPNYYKEGKPYLDEVEFMVIADAVALTNALVTDEVQFMEGVDIKTLNMLKRNPDIALQLVPSAGHDSFDMNTQVAPFDNKDVRLALKYAINREEIIEKIFFGTAKLGNDNPLGPSMPFAVDPQPQHAYNIEKAKEHLKKAGYETLKIDLSVAPSSATGAVEAASLFKEQAAKAGIEINLVLEANDGYWDKVCLKKPFASAEYFGRATADWLFTQFYQTGADWNPTHFSNKRFDELLVAARGETDQAKRGSQYAEMQQILHDEGGAIVYAFLNYTNAVSKKVGFNKVGGVFPLDNGRASERWWLTA
ncbi:ABC transporter substrate-binding protein [Mesorhizobium sp. M7A.F.Ca.ET.027.02.1.1]|uniref:ABC transporter substrate-binding protein n=1 Tax=Mesorhizobium sp. M7A.F.Ca.ET.027.02.1.1 TaxID=2496655 RepID=UPI000FD34880|nr:ABC transporter substrate-binding protein [Mesorhizobium sp. M7A.F.Ca.ET.027.02.1.1]RVD08126.1 ABC transporter substrate-binding protein [Mesorhizobium sp. M7A.F.Ca.ET.027.02.1.1]